MSEPSPADQPWHRNPGLRACILLFVGLYLPFLVWQGWLARWKGNVDFPSFQLGAQLAFVYHHSPYDFEALKRLGEPLHQPLYPWLYPPVTLLLFYPMGRMEYMDAKQVMLLINHGAWLCCVGGMVWILKQRLRVTSTHPFVPGRNPWMIMSVWIVALFAFTPLIANLEHGQVNLLVLAGLLLAWAGMREARHPLLSACGLTLAILLKTYPLLLVPWLLWRGERRVVLWTVVLGTLSVLLSLILLPIEWWQEWLVKVAPSGGYGRAALGVMDPASPWNQSVNGFFSRLLMPNHFNQPWWALPWLGKVLSWSAVLLILWRTGRSILVRASSASGETLDRDMSLMITTTFLVAPLSWEHHFVYLLPAFLVFLGEYGTGRLSGRLAWPMLGCFGVLALPFVYDAPELRQGLPLLLSSLPLYAVLGVWGVLLKPPPPGLAQG